MEKWKTLCRACLGSSDHFTYFLFENVGAATYTFCTSVEVDVEDNLPKALCEPCYKLLIQFVKFKNTCIKSQDELLNQSRTANDNLIVPKLEKRDLDFNFVATNLTDYSQDYASKNEDISEFNNEDFQKVEDDSHESEISQDWNNKKFKKKKEIQPMHTILPKVEGAMTYILFTNSPIYQANCLNQPSPVNDKQNAIPTLYTCNICFKVCSKKEVLEAHYLEHKNQVQKTTKPKKGKHLQTQPKKGFSFTCDICNKEFTNKKDYEVHCLNHGVVKLKYPCEKCSNKYETWSGLKRHIDTNHSVTRLEDLKCKVCGRVCNSRHTLQEHIYKNHSQGSRSYSVCHICGMSFAGKDSALKAHIETHSDNRERRHICPKCGKKFFRNSNLRAHILCFHGNAKFICDYCKREFKEKQTLARHIRTHTGQTRHQCDVCQKKFEQKSAFVVHQRVHTGERPFECDFCAKAFMSKRILMDHRRVHTGEKPYKCDICGHSFSQKGTMNRHVKTHSNQGNQGKVKSVP